jgi:hypothetical protein
MATTKRRAPAPELSPHEKALAELVDQISIAKARVQLSEINARIAELNASAQEASLRRLKATREIESLQKKE